MESQNLNAQEILAGRNARGHVEVDPAVVRDHVVHAPLAAALIEAVLPDLEPVLPCRAAGRRVVDLGEPRCDGSLVRPRNRVVHVVRELGAADDVPPVRTESVAGGDRDDRVGLGAALAAGHVGAVDILYRVVVVGSPDARELTMILAVDREFLEE